MSTRPHPHLIVLLTLALLCSTPTILGARPTTIGRKVFGHIAHRTQPAARKQGRQPYLHASRHQPLRQTARRQRIVLPDRPRTAYHVRTQRSLRRIDTVARPPRTLLTPLAIPARTAPEAQETGIPHPPSFDTTELTPPTISVPVVSVIRPNADKPQLPTVQEAAATPEILPSLYNKRGRLVVPAPLKGSHEILLHQNEVANQDGLVRVQDENDLDAMRRRAMLVALPVSGGMQVDERLPANRRYCRPWTAQFLSTLARAHFARFHTALQVNSAVRTVEFQQRLIRTNGNAAPAEGETASPHLTGQAVDLAKRGLSLSEIAWMRGYLLPLVQEGKIDVEEEFQQSCFHISVYKKYLPQSSAPPRSIASTHREGAAALAIAIP